MHRHELLNLLEAHRTTFMDEAGFPAGVFNLVNGDGPGVGLLATLLAHCPELTVLATSREPLRIAGERLFEAPPLAVPDIASVDATATPGLSPDEALTSDAICLLCERAASGRTGFALQPADVPAAIAVCRRLDGMPLAIELAAARLGALPLAALAQRLDASWQDG